ncbi:hypothetical protein GQ607_000656 [Colletotrichum asianum]|uniref:2EXR domain-containing protein n=1 Tax=Colletotrichum asianum TaxID=702518 RepID=A0A8H3WU12_9PEZI|nr:hypothetical protein GQ607_000656 [Colletotrichum asianum]
MPTLTTFTCFPELPPELREMIWTEALTASPCVWYANKNCFYGYEEEEGKARDPFFTRISESPPECRVGFTNRESWFALHKVYDRSHCIVDQPPLSGVYWVDFGKTLFHLDSWETGIYTLMALEKTFLERIEHVGLDWHMRPQMGEVCQFLAAHCPRLKTITLQKRDWQLSYYPDCLDDPLLGPDPTAFCEWILGYEGPEITHDVKDKSELRDELMDYWEEPGRKRPKMHLVSSCSPNFNFIVQRRFR